MTHTLNDQRLQAWRMFITTHATLIEVIDREMVAAQQIPLHWYDVLIELNNAPYQRLRMHELARRVVLSRSTLTRLADRLEAAGLLSRERSATDRRGAYAVLTKQGVVALRQAWPIYERGITAYFAQHLSDTEARLLMEALMRMRDAAHPQSAPEDERNDGGGA